MPAPTDATEPSAGQPRVAVFAPAPALVCTFEHPHDRSDPEVALNVGGQGPWVARAVAALGAHAVLVVPLGGDTGRAARHLLTDAKYEVRPVECQAATACYVEERRGGDRTCIRDARGGRFGPRELDGLYDAALAAALDADVCVVTGSPWDDHLDDGLITRLTADLANLGRTTVADLAGSQLDAAAAGGVDWLKVAHDDLAEGHGTPADEASLWRAAERLATAGARQRNVVVSRSGEEPALVVTPTRRYRVAAPRLTPVDQRGSGDAMTAALATGLAERRPTDELLRRAAAAGAVNAVHKGSATPDIGVVERLVDAVTIDELPAPGHEGTGHDAA